MHNDERSYHESAAILKDSNGDISVADHPIYSVFSSRIGFSGSADFNGANSGLTKFNRYVGENNARVVIRLVTIYSISFFCFCLNLVLSQLVRTA